MIRFVYNPTSWAAAAPVPGGMTDCLVQPVLGHLDDEAWSLGDRPAADAVNVYYTHRTVYPGGVALAEPGRVSVFSSHGIADKGWRPARRMLGQFDYVLTSGPLWTDRYIKQGIAASRVLEVGYPKLDPIVNGEVPAPVRDGRVRVVWAPTHGGGGESGIHGPASPAALRGPSSWWHRDAVLDLLPASEFDVVEAPHPRHRPDGRATLAEYVGADVVIGDAGSTVYEAWALGLPVVFPAWQTAFGVRAKGMRYRGGTLEAEIYRAGIGRHADSPDMLAALVAAAADDGITDAEREFVEPILPARYRGTSGQRHAEALASLDAGETPRSARSTVVFRQRRTGSTRRLQWGSTRAKTYARSDLWEIVEVH